MTNLTPSGDDAESSDTFVGILLRDEVLSGILLTGALIVAIAWATLGSSSYLRVITAHVSVPTVPPSVVHDVETLVTNLLMLVFFLAIGLEIGRERASGALAHRSDAVLPIVAALGGMLGAALVYLGGVLLDGSSNLAGGWGIPMATDVAFTLAALSLLSTRAPRSLRIFLLTLAIADDVGSVIILALVGHQRVDVSSGVRVLCALGVVATVALTTLARRRRLGPLWFVALALLLWWLLAHVGIEPTLAGVVIGVLAPTDARPRAAGLTLERAAAPLSSFVILPLFALVAAGVDLSVKPWLGQADLIGPLVAARVLGKSLGIVGACLLCVRLGFGRLPRSISWPQLGAAALFCGIGFTVPLLFAEHTFAGEPARLAATKVALVGASVLCAAVGVVVLSRVLPRRTEP